MSNDEDPYQCWLHQFLSATGDQSIPTESQSNPSFHLPARDDHLWPTSSPTASAENQQDLFQLTSGDFLAPDNAADDLYLGHQIYQRPASTTNIMSSGLLPFAYISSDEQSIEYRIAQLQHSAECHMTEGGFEYCPNVGPVDFADFAAPNTQTQSTPLHAEERTEPFFDALFTDQPFTSGETLSLIHYADWQAYPELPCADVDQHAPQEITRTVADVAQAPSSVSEEVATIQRPIAQVEPAAAPHEEERNQESVPVGPRPAQQLVQKRKRTPTKSTEAPKAGSSSSVRNTKKARTKEPVNTPMLSKNLHIARIDATRIIVHPLPDRCQWNSNPDPIVEHTVQASTINIHGKDYVVDPDNIRTWGAESHYPHSYGPSSASDNLPQQDAPEFICILCPKVFATGSGQQRKRILDAHFREVHGTAPRGHCYAKLCPKTFHGASSRLEGKRKLHILGTGDKSKKKLHRTKECRKQIAEGNVREGLTVPKKFMEAIMAQYQKDLEAQTSAGKAQEGGGEDAESAGEYD